MLLAPDFTKKERMMIITVVCDVLGEENNGTTVAAMNLIKFLQQKGHTVRILCADQARKNQENVFVVPNYNFGKILNDYVHKVGVTLAKPDEEIVRNAIDGADIVHIMMPLSLGIFAAKIAHEQNVPITAGFHMQAENLTSYLKLNKVKVANKLVYKTIYNNVYQYADGIHYPTEFVRNEFERNVKRATPAFIVSNGVHNYVRKKETPKPIEFRDKIVILTTGRYAREKSQDTLLKAVRYSAYKDRIQLILAGQGTKEKYYKKLAKKLPVAPVFQLFSREEMVDVINYSDMYVHPAEIELEGIACLEAITCGKLTIVSDSELSATKGFAVDERCVFKNRKPKDLAKVIDFWISHPTEKEACENKFLAYSSRFNQERCMDEMNQFFSSVYEKNKNR